MGLSGLFKERSNQSGPDEDGELKKSTRLEESLQEIQSRYRKLLNHTQAIQYTHDLEGQFLSVDQEITEFLGYDRNSLLKMNIRALLAPEVANKFEAYLAEIKRQGAAKGLMVVQTAAGENRILKFYNTLRTEGVPIPFVQGIAYDVTEKKQTEKALEQLSEQLSIVLKSLPIVCYIGKAEKDYGVTYITHNVKAITGFEQTDVTSTPSFWANRVHPEDAPKLFAELLQIFEKGFHEHQYRWQVADGSYKWCYDYRRLIKSPDGSNYIIGMMQDITERKRAEEALLHAAQEWRTTFDGINDFVSLLDLDGKILRCNKAMKDFVGKPFNEILNHSCWEIILGVTTPVEDCPFLRMKETLQRETTILSVKDLWFNVSVDPIFDQAGHLIGAVNIIADITKRKYAEEAVTKLSQENAIIAEIGRIISSTLDIDEVYERFSEQVRKLIPFDRIEIITINLQDHTITISYITGLGVPGRKAGNTIPMSGTAVQEVFRTRSSLLIQPLNEEELSGRFPPLLSSFQAGLRSMIFVPLFSENQVIGALSLKTTKPDFYTERDLRLAERVGDQIAGAIANAHLFIERKRAEESAARFSQENAIMAEIGRVISSTLNIEEVYERFAEEVRKLIPFDRTAVNIINLKDYSGSVAYAWGAEIPHRKQGEAFPLVDSFSEEIITTRSGILIQNADESELAERYPGLRGIRAGFRSMISVPLISKDEVIGIFHLRSFKPNAYAERDLNLAERVGNQIAGAIANAKLYAEQKKMEEALRKSEERFRELYDHAPLGYHEYDAEGRITNVNRTDLEMLGYTAEEMIGQQIWKFNVDGDTLREEVLAKLAGTSPPGRNLERIYRRKDGTTIPVLVEDRQILDEKGQIKGIRCTIQDITARKQAEDEKESLREQLRQSQKMEAIGKLAGGVAHDFNNLLTVIHGYSELLINSLDQSSRFRQDVQEIMHASERASSLTRQLLAFSRKQVLQPKVLDLNAHVSNMDKMLRRMIGEDIELVTLLTRDLGRVKADPGQIEQVILNLAVNAKDAMLNGGKLTIETANAKLDENYARSRVGVIPGDYMMLSVSDTGVGMSSETRERIFEPFFTTKEKGKGTGLGLSTVYGIVQQSGGNIWVYSEPGLGTTFKIYLPRIEEGTESLRPAAFPTKPLQGSETVLLVEDEEMVRKLAYTVLQRNGYKVLEASSGDEALDVVQGRNGNPIHLIVTDVVMPGMSGRQLADRVASLRPEIRILYMSGYTDDAIVHHGVLDPGIAYIQKPFTPEALASKVRETLDGN